MAHGQADAGIALDGRLDETDWNGATAFDDFRMTMPFTGAAAPVATDARVLATPEALFIGFHTSQPASMRKHGRSPRDTEFMDADEVAFIVDFEGRGTTAYEFAVSLSGSVRDGIILQQTNYSYDWDTVWYSAVAEDETGWSIEIELPWSVAPMGPVIDGQRRIGVFFGLYLQTTGNNYSFPGNDYRNPTFVADMHPIEVPAYDASLLAWIPYLSSTTDLLVGSSRERGGLDVIWKPDASRQLTATINPDFGQVESDDLVVNFTAIETFLTEKRPFFTQNQQLFDLRTTLDGRIINTRRIGAAPDAGPEGQTDILGAAKYSASYQGWEYGMFAATEDDSALANGRDYFAARLRRHGEDWSAGYLGTHTDRPTLDRTATVHSLDAEYSPAPGWAFRGQAILTSTEDPAAGAMTRGAGAWLAALYAPGGRFEQNLFASWYDDGYDVNDLGFMKRNDIREIQTQSFWYRQHYAEDSVVQSSRWELDAHWRTTDTGRRLPSWIQPGRKWNFRDGSAITVRLRPTTSGVDDLTTRGGPAFRLPSQPDASISYLSRRTDRWQWIGEIQAFREGLERTGYQCNVSPVLYAGTDLNFSVDLTYRDSPDWLIWRPDIGKLARHARRQLQAAFNTNWYPTSKSEFRIRLQWAAVKARDGQAYDIGPDGALAPAAGVAEDFSLSDLALQARYRYEFKPLSELFVVYSFGGSALQDHAASFGELWTAGVNSPAAQQFVVKLAYRF
ncbi:MAG: DUF5916 domain-containing protein [Steroidobacteraceae bacterium]